MNREARESVDTNGAAVADIAKLPGRDDTENLRKVVAICSHLSTAAAQDTELDAIVQILADSTGAEVIVLDRALQPVTNAGRRRSGSPTDLLGIRAETPGFDKALEAVARNRRVITLPPMPGIGASVVVAPVSAGQNDSGYLMTIAEFDEDLSEDAHLLVTEHAAMVCGVVLSRKLVVAGAVGRVRQELVEGLLLAHSRCDSEAEQWARHLGLDTTRAHYVVVLSLPVGQGGAVLPVVESTLQRTAPTAVAAQHTDDIVIITPVCGDGDATDEAHRLAKACANALADARLGPATIGIGTPSARAVEIARSHDEARVALAARQRAEEVGGTGAFADLGIERLLLRIPDADDLRRFAQEVIGALIAEEKATGVAYLATLSAYFDENHSPSRAGGRLHLHANSVSYRIRRVEEITGLSLQSRRDRLMLDVALTIINGPEARR